MIYQTGNCSECSLAHSWAFLVFLHVKTRFREKGFVCTNLFSPYEAEMHTQTWQLGSTPVSVIWVHLPCLSLLRAPPYLTKENCCCASLTENGAQGRWVYPEGQQWTQQVAGDRPRRSGYAGAICQSYHPTPQSIGSGSCYQVSCCLSLNTCLWG